MSMRISATLLSLSLLLAAGCSNANKPVEITVKSEDSSPYKIRITVDDKEDVVIDDPYEAKIQELSRGFAADRSHFIQNRESMSSEQRKAYGKRRDEVAAEIRELDKLRRSHIRAQMEVHQGVGFTLEFVESETDAKSTSNYLESLEK